MMRFAVGLWALFLASGMPAVPALAGHGSGEISDLHTEKGIALISVAKIDKGAACGSKLRFAIDLSKAKGRAFYAQALAAHLRGRPVNIEGTGGCEVREDSETVLFIAAP